MGPASTSAGTGSTCRFGSTHWLHNRMMYSTATPFAVLCSCQGCTRDPHALGFLWDAVTMTTRHEGREGGPLQAERKGIDMN